MTGDASPTRPRQDFDSGTSQDSASDSMRGLDGSLGLTGDHGGAGSGGEGPDLDSFADAHEVSLQEHLAAQAGERLSGTDLMVAQQLIDQVDEAGYFRGPLLELAQRLGVPLREVERVLAIVQTFDPPGIAARTLSECLALQAKEADRYDPAMARLIDNLDYLAKGNLGALKRICGVDDEDLADMIRELRAFDPKPGCKFMRAEAGEAAVVPDVFVARRSGGWAIELNSATLPRLLVNRSYYTELSGGAQDRKSKAWLSECLQSANWLVKALDQRARTIVKVATEIVKQQDGFFRHGVAQLRPLTLRQVAEAIGMHESTVSRVTSNNYLSCDRGLYELKYFFRSGIQSNDGGDGPRRRRSKAHQGADRRRPSRPRPHYRRRSASSRAAPRRASKPPAATVANIASAWASRILRPASAPAARKAIGEAGRPRGYGPAPRLRRGCALAPAAPNLKEPPCPRERRDYRLHRFALAAIGPSPALRRLGRGGGWWTFDAFPSGATCGSAKAGRHGNHRGSTT